MTASHRPLVSIIVPVYDVECYLDTCLDSIRGQTYNRLEIIVVEDCSTDGSLAKIEPHLADPRVRLIRHKRNSGLSAARNTGIEAATGEFVLFVDSDDAIAPELVEACMAKATETGADVVVFDFAAFQNGEALPQTGSFPGAEKSRGLEVVEYLKLPHFAWLKFIRSGLLRDSGLRFPVGFYYEDWPFHWELGFLANRMEIIGFRGYNYRLRGDSITGSAGRKLLHIMHSQALVADVVERYSGFDETKRILADRVVGGVWRVLMNIESSLLPEAIYVARSHLSEMERTLRNHGGGQWKAAVVPVLVRMPRRIGVCGVRGLRFAIGRLSPARRDQRRRLAAMAEGTSQPESVSNPGEKSSV